MQFWQLQFPFREKEKKKKKSKSANDLKTFNGKIIFK